MDKKIKFFFYKRKIIQSKWFYFPLLAFCVRKKTNCRLSHCALQVDDNLYNLTWDRGFFIDKKMNDRKDIEKVVSLPFNSKSENGRKFIDKLNKVVESNCNIPLARFFLNNYSWLRAVCKLFNKDIVVKDKYVCTDIALIYFTDYLGYKENLDKVYYPKYIYKKARKREIKKLLFK